MPTETPAVDERSPSEQALRRYHQRLRPWRITYAAVLVALIVAAGVVVKLAYVHGELSHTTLRTAPAPAPDLPLANPSGRLTRAWANPDHTAIGTPYDHGTVVTYSTHAISGRDARTGDVRWSYTRTDRATCTAAQLDDVTIAVFRLHGDCTELTGLDTGTGKRLWTRTLDQDSHLVTGTPAFTANNDTLVITTPQVIYALSPDGTSDNGRGGLNRWLFAEPGCTINGAAFGSAGALISQTCSNPQCNDRKFCGSGPQLLLRDPYAAVPDDSTDKNPDQIKWNLIGNTMLPVSAGAVIAATAPGSDTLTTFSAKGKSIATLPLVQPLAAATPGTSARTAPQTAAAADAQLVRIGAQTYAIDSTGKRYAWHAATTALPTVTSASGNVLPGLSQARIAVPLSDGIAQLSPATGAVQQRFAAPGVDTGSQIFPLGTGFLVAGPATVVYR